MEEVRTLKELTWLCHSASPMVTCTALCYSDSHQVVDTVLVTGSHSQNRSQTLERIDLSTVALNADEEPCLLVGQLSLCLPGLENLLIAVVDQAPMT